MRHDLKFNPQAIWSKIVSLKNYLLTLAVLLLLGLTALQISRIIHLDPDQASIEAERQKLRSSRVKFDQTTIDALNQRSSSPSNSLLNNLGKADPFSP